MNKKFFIFVLLFCVIGFMSSQVYDLGQVGGVHFQGTVEWGRCLFICGKRIDAGSSKDFTIEKIYIKGTNVKIEGTNTTSGSGYLDSYTKMKVTDGYKKVAEVYPSDDVFKHTVNDWVDYGPKAANEKYGGAKWEIKILGFTIKDENGEGKEEGSVDKNAKKIDTTNYLTYKKKYLEENGYGFMSVEEYDNLMALKDENLLNEKKPDKEIADVINNYNDLDSLNDDIKNYNNSGLKDNATIAMEIERIKKDNEERERQNKLEQERMELAKRLQQEKNQRAQNLANAILHGANITQQLANTILSKTKSRGGSGTTSNSSGESNGLCPEGQRLVEEMQKDESKGLGDLAKKYNEHIKKCKQCSKATGFTD